MYRLILISFIIIQTGVLSFNRYCDLGCRTRYGIDRHIVCERARVGCGPGPRCRNFRVIPMTDDLRQVIVDMHNELRNNVSLGLEEQGPQPTAANMNRLYWNNELANIAQCLANTCQFRHDKCRRTEHFVLVGQNVGKNQQSHPNGLGDVEVIKSRIQDWYDEVAIYHPGNIPYFTDIPGVGHYTQMVWGQIQYVGCAAVFYTNSGWNTRLLVCNYAGPTTGGNMYGEEVYERGVPCSKCSSGTSCDKKYEGLCAIDDPVQTHNST